MISTYVRWATVEAGDVESRIHSRCSFNPSNSLNHKTDAHLVQTPAIEHVGLGNSLSYTTSTLILSTPTPSMSHSSRKYKIARKKRAEYYKLNDKLFPGILGVKFSWEDDGDGGMTQIIKLIDGSRPRTHK